MKKLIPFFSLCTFLFLVSCGINNNITFTTNPSNCSNENGVPYCMAVTVQNNNGGQNFISSTNFPINNLSVSISGATNILSPATNKTLMDPNNCTGTTIKPGANCTFYLKISGESYPVQSIETINLTLNYNVQNNIFGTSSTTSGSANLKLYEITNLYIPQDNGYLWQYNAFGFTGIGQIESADTPLSAATDTTSLGLLYIGGNNGIYAYGSGITSSSISEGNITGANNLFTVSGNLLVTGLNAGTGIWSYSLSGESWANSSTPTFQFNNIATANANAVSASSIIYLANSTQVYNCATSTSSTSNCVSEGPSFNTAVTKLVFLNGVDSPYTGLYAGTISNSGAISSLFAESSILTIKSWTPVGTLSTINALVTDNFNNLYSADGAGNIWITNASSPTNATQFVSKLSLPGVTAMAIDQFGQLLYFIVPNGNSFSLYSCPIGSSISSCSPTLISNNAGQTGAGTPIGLAIASQLVN